MIFERLENITFRAVSYHKDGQAQPLTPLHHPKEKTFDNKMRRKIYDQWDQPIPLIIARPFGILGHGREQEKR
jgi:hypothetical protein